MTDDLMRLVSEAMPLVATLGIRPKVIAADETVLTMEWRPEVCTTAGIMHGGALMALADTAGAACAFARLVESAPGAGTSTIESNTHFFAAVRGGTVTATSRPLHSGRSTIVVQTDLRDDSGRLVAQTTQTQAVLAPR
ncbi:PaaI family thioesterase [Pseudonocardia eucalypti]|uniref:PaaI family thioesterase n=1 Tax=Pseudonocardia eucalypti TaxID=648755 RepID=UPI0031ED9E4D